MTHKQRKALARHKAIVKARNIRNNNLKANPWALGNPLKPSRHTYRVWDL